MAKKALIIGAEGQDGQLLQAHLQSLGYSILGLGRTRIFSPDDPNWTGRVDLLSPKEVETLLGDWRPDEAYYLAAYHRSSETPADSEIEDYRRNYEVNLLGVVNVLEGIRARSPQTRFLYASSSHIYGKPQTELQDEDSPVLPVSIYGMSKLAGLLSVRRSRKEFGLFAAGAILFNHESVLRPAKFLSTKIIEGALAIKRGEKSELVLGDLQAQADWGYAPDYVRAMHLILAEPKPDDFVVATGQKHTVSDFVETTFHLLGLDPTRYVREDRRILAQSNLPLVGNPKKLVERTGWKPTVSFVQMIEEIVKARQNG